MKSPTSHLWSSAQKRAYCRLIEIAELFLTGDFTNLSFRPRLTPLLVGKSGLGKTHVIREVAKELGVPCLRLTSSSWIVPGARTDPTMLRVQEFVANNDQGIIQLDELCKFRLGSGGLADSWSKGILGDVYDLLDRNPSQPAKDREWSDEVVFKLRNDFWLVATGTFQEFWIQAQKPKVGFGAAQSAEELLENVRRMIATTDLIEPELLLRFNKELILMEPPSENDFRNAAEENGLSQLAASLHEPLDFAEAVGSELGARWMEEAMGRLLLKAREANRLDLIPLRSFDEGISSDDREEDSSGDNPKYGIESSVL